jgi:hypothetical protein
MRIRRSKDFFTGIMFLFFGAAAMFLSATYKIGTGANMGPGYFPFVLGLLLVIFGSVFVITSTILTKEPQENPSWQFKPLALVLSSVVLFSLILRPLGLLLSTAVLVVMASMASHEFRWKEALLNATVLVGIILLVFVYFLEFNMPVVPWFLAGRI